MLFRGENPDVQVFRGAKQTRAGVFGEVDPKAPLGSLYVSSDRVYVKMTNAGASTDWLKLATPTAAD